MQMSERQRRVLSLLERLGRGRDLPAAARRVWFVATRSKSEAQDLAGGP